MLFYSLKTKAPFTCTVVGIEYISKKSQELFMKKYLLPLFFSISLFSSYAQSDEEESKEITFDTLDISKRFFDFSKCPKENYSKCFERISPDKIFNFIGVSDSKTFKKTSLRQAKNFVVANIDRQDFEPLERWEIIGNYRPILRRRTFYTCTCILINVNLSLNAENVKTSL